jgi:arsenate reductase
MLRHNLLRLTRITAEFSPAAIPYRSSGGLQPRTSFAHSQPSSLSHMPAHYNVLFLCTGNSARSILAEALLNHKAHGVFIAYSAGGHPSGTPRPEALAQLSSAGISTASLRSNSWDEFALITAPQMNFVFTVCDNAANQVCPFWPGQPMTAHWGIPDPATVQGKPEQIARAFRDTFTILDRRISLFLKLPLATRGQLDIQKEIIQIGRA